MENEKIIKALMFGANSAIEYIESIPETTSKALAVSDLLEFAPQLLASLLLERQKNWAEHVIAEMEDEDSDNLSALESYVTNTDIYNNVLQAIESLLKYEPSAQKYTFN